MNIGIEGIFKKETLFLLHTLKSILSHIFSFYPHKYSIKSDLGIQVNTLTYVCNWKVSQA
jgi:hypothetical protein